jgi:cytochrome c2
MRKELEIIQIIEKYLNNELSVEDKAAFEKKLNNNPELKLEVDKQRLIQEGVSNVALKGKIQKAWKSYRLGKFGTMGGIATLAIIAATAATLWFANQSPEQYAENIKYALNESGEEVWADADELVPAQFFTVNADEDNVLQTEGGLVVAIPKGSLLQNGKPVTGNIEIEIKEALMPEDIVLSGLSTKSGDQLLETGGMFYFNARKDGENLYIDKENGIVVDIPTDDYKSGMEVYDGFRKEDGSIDWQNPKPIETFLTTLNIMSLNFYPPNYENKLFEMGEGENAKPWKDSLYYSFAGEGRDTYIASEIWYDSVKSFEINPAKIKTIWDKKFNNSLLATKEFEERLQYIFQTCDDDILDLYVNNLGKRLSAIDSMVIEKLCGDFPKSTEPLTSSLDGESLFRANCVSCHKPKKHSTGPMLAGARKRWADAGEAENIYTYVKDPVALRVSGNSPYATKIAEYSPSEMTPQAALTNEEIEAILVYCDNYGLVATTSHYSWNSLLMQQATQQLADSISMVELYEAAEAIQDGPNLCSIFQNFALQNKGRVKGGDKAAKLLSEYYAKQAKANAQALAKTQKAFWSKYEKLNKDLSQMTSDQQQKEIERLMDNFKEECELNLEDACRQLGIKHKFDWNPKPKYTATVTTPGWKNIDQAVVASVQNRETLNYTENGKTAVIKYEACEVEVTNAKYFERVMVYLMPRELNSFMRMPEAGNGFKENLNELIHYQLVAVGMKDNEVFYAKLDEALPQSYSLTLEKTTKKELRKLMRKGNLKSLRNDVLDDVKFQLNSIRMNKERVVFEDMAKFRNELQRSIFPCASIEGTMSVPALPMPQ